MSALLLRHAELEDDVPEEGDPKVKNSLTKDGKRASIRFGSDLLDEVAFLVFAPLFTQRWLRQVNEGAKYRCVMVFHAQSNGAEETAAILTTGVVQQSVTAKPTQTLITLFSWAAIGHAAEEIQMQGLCPDESGEKVADYIRELKIRTGPVLIIFVGHTAPLCDIVRAPTPSLASPAAAVTRTPLPPGESFLRGRRRGHHGSSFPLLWGRFDFAA